MFNKICVLALVVAALTVVLTGCYSGVSGTYSGPATVYVVENGLEQSNEKIIPKKIDVTVEEIDYNEFIGHIKIEGMAKQSHSATLVDNALAFETQVQIPVNSIETEAVEGSDEEIQVSMCSIALEGLVDVRNGRLEGEICGSNERCPEIGEVCVKRKRAISDKFLPV